MRAFKAFTAIAFQLILVSTSSGPGPRAAWASSGGDRAGNGGGLAELNFQYAYLSLPWIYENCLANVSCLQDPQLLRTLNGILGALPREFRSNPKLVFESGKAHPERFIINGTVRIAVTGDQVGDPIYLNLDLLYPLAPNGLPTALDVGAAISILTHELGHHQGAFHDPQGERYLDLLGASVRAHSNRSVEVMQVDDWDRSPDDFSANIQLTAVHSSAGITDPTLDGPQTSLLLSDGARGYPLDPELFGKLRCPVKNGNAGKLIGYRLHHMAWKTWRYVSRDTLSRIYPLETRALIACRYPDDEVYPTFYTDRIVRMEFTFKLPSNADNGVSYRYVDKSLQVSLVAMP